jgi:xanthine dehydrogenase accessory factor
MPESPYVEAIVVRCARPTIARPGDRATIAPDGTIDGFVGGSCADETVRLQALRCLETGEAVLLRIEPGAVDGVGGVGGVGGLTPSPSVDGLSDVGGLTPSPSVDGLSEQVKGSDPLDAAVVVANPCLSGGALEVFLQPHVPAPRVAVVGDSPVARALARLAPLAGFAVTGAPADGDFAAVVATLGHGDEDAVADALAAGADYVGLVASRRRGAVVVDGLRARGLDTTRLHARAGLDIGARTHSEIALSVVAELVAERRRPAVVPEPAPEPVVHAGAHGAHCHP